MDKVALPSGTCPLLAIQQAVSRRGSGETEAGVNRLQDRKPCCFQEEMAAAGQGWDLGLSLGKASWDAFPVSVYVSVYACPMSNCPPKKALLCIEQHRTHGMRKEWGGALTELFKGLG